MINLTVVVDNDEAIRKFRELQKVAKTTTSNVVSDSDRMDMAMRKLATALGSLGVGFSLTEFARKVAMVRGEFQQLEVAFTTMLGNKEKADALMAKTVDFAAKTPFDLQGVAAGTKQLLAYGSNAEEVTDELRMLGDIAAGLSMPLGDLVYLYGTTRTQGRMFTMDLRQFMGRGVPLAEELAKKFGVTKAEVGKLVTEGKVGFNDMKDALVAMTSEGGKFYNLMEEQSKTITGKMSNLGDAVDQMFNNIGKQSEGIISGAIDSAAYLVENYEKIGKVLMDIIVAYGSYKAAVMTVNALNKARVIYLAAEVTATKLSAAANKQLTASNILLAKSLKALNVAKYLTNPYVWAGAAIGVLIFSTYKLITAKSLEEKAQEKVNKQMEEYNQKAEEEKQKASENISKMNDANISTYERVKAYKDLVAAYPELLDKYDKEKIKLMEIAELEKEIAGITQQRTLKEADDKIAEYDKKIAGGAVVSGMSGQTSTDTNQINKWKAERAEWEKKRNQILADQEQAKFDALPKPEKVQKLTKDIEALNTQVAEYNKKIDDAPEWGKTSLTMARDGVKAQITELEKEKSTLEDAIEKEKAESAGSGTDETEVQKRQKAIAKAKEDAIREANKAEQDAIREGITDKIKLLEFEKEAELAEIQSRIDATTDAETKAALQRKYNAVEMRYDTRIGAEQTQRDKDAEEAQKQHLNSLLEQYATYEMKRKAIIDKYNSEYATIAGQNINGEYDAVLKELENAFKKALQELDIEKIGGSDLFVRLFEDASKMSNAKLKAVIKDTKALLSYLKGLSTVKPTGFTDEQLESLKGSASDIESIYNNLIEKENEFNSRYDYPFSSFVNGAKKLKKAAEMANKALVETDEKKKKVYEEQSESLHQEGLSDIKKGAGEASKALSDLSSAFYELAEASGNSALEQAGALMQNMSAAAQGFASGGWIGAIVGGVTDMITQTMQGVAHVKEYTRQYQQSMTDFANGIKLLNLSLRDEDYDTLFGTKSMLKASDAYKKASESLDEYMKKVSASDIMRDTWAALAQTFGLGEAARRGDNALEGMQIKTKDYTGWQEFWGKSDEYKSLKDIAPELWDENGEFNTDNAKVFLETNKQITEEQRSQIQNVIDLKEAYDKSITAIDDQINSLFGDIATDLTDIIFDSVRNGTDAWDAFQDRGLEVIDKIGRAMIQELIIQEYLNSFQENLRNAFKGETPEEVSNNLSQVTRQIFDGIGTVINGATEAAKEWDTKMAEEGWDISRLYNTESQQDATSKGFQAMSQDTGDELNGRFTDIQGKVTEIRDYILQMMASGQMRLGEMINIRDIAIQLNGNVEQIKTYSMVLPEMNDTLASMNKKLDNL